MPPRRRGASCFASREAAGRRVREAGLCGVDSSVICKYSERGFVSSIFLTLARVSEGQESMQHGSESTTQRVVFDRVVELWGMFGESRPSVHLMLSVETYTCEHESFEYPVTRECVNICVRLAICPLCQFLLCSVIVPDVFGAAGCTRSWRGRQSRDRREAGSLVILQTPFTLSLN